MTATRFMAVCVRGCAYVSRYAGSADHAWRLADAHTYRFPGHEVGVKKPLLESPNSYAILSWEWAK